MTLARPASRRPQALVTGGAGFIGSHLCERLLSEGYRVVCMDFPGALDEVYHFASASSPADFGRIPIEILKSGAMGTHNCLGLARARGARFMLASSSEVYGDPLVHPQHEEYRGNVSTTGPRSVYDEAKRYAEALTMAYHRYYRLDTRIVRIFNSILADEQVLYDDGHELRREKVSDLAARLASRSVRRGLRPAPGRSPSPSIPSALKRWRGFLTVFGMAAEFLGYFGGAQSLPTQRDDLGPEDPVSGSVAATSQFVDLPLFFGTSGWRAQSSFGTFASPSRSAVRPHAYVYRL
jgi:nucleoside-diphosphate-sugar epimerase